MDALARGNLKETRRVFSVSELNQALKELIESKFPFVWVEGEIANVKTSQAGHIYFSLRDDGASLRAVLFRTYRSNLNFKLEDGLHVLCFGRLSLYETRGEYQLIVQQVEPVGYGVFRLALQQLQEKLAKEGLLDPARKRPLPFWPKVIGLITSLHGAAIHDFLRVGLGRNPLTRVLVYPVKVQGEDAPLEIMEGLLALSSFNEVEVIVITRGGGSIEDLIPFNHEGLARAIAASPVPVVSAVGHEIDVTICDLVADVRAPTPTAAAQLVFPKLADIENTLSLLARSLKRAMTGKIEREKERLIHLARRLKDPQRKIAEQQKLLDSLKRRLDLGISKQLTRKQQSLQSLARELHVLSPLAVLERGYSIARRVPDGKVLRSAEEASRGDELEIILSQGRLKATVKEVIARDENL